PEQRRQPRARPEPRELAARRRRATRHRAARGAGPHARAHAGAVLRNRGRVPARAARHHAARRHRGPLAPAPPMNRRTRANLRVAAALVGLLALAWWAYRGAESLGAPLVADPAAVRAVTIE